MICISFSSFIFSNSFRSWTSFETWSNRSFFSCSWKKFENKIPKIWIVLILQHYNLLWFWFIILLQAVDLLYKVIKLNYWLHLQLWFIIYSFCFTHRKQMNFYIYASIIISLTLYNPSLSSIYIHNLLICLIDIIFCSTALFSQHMCCLGTHIKKRKVRKKENFYTKWKFSHKNPLSIPICLSINILETVKDTVSAIKW